MHQLSQHLDSPKNAAHQTFPHTIRKLELSLSEDAAWAKEFQDANSSWGMQLETGYPTSGHSKWQTLFPPCLEEIVEHGPQLAI